MSHLLDCDSLASYPTVITANHGQTIDADAPDALPRNAVRIQITQFINPHLFWFKCGNARRAASLGLGTVDAQQQLATLEAQVAAYVERMAGCDRQLSSLGYRPRAGEMVAVQHMVWDKWVRARCDEALEIRGASGGWTFVLWAVDHG